MKNIFYNLTFPDVVDLENIRWRYPKVSPQLVKYITHVFGTIIHVLEAIWTKESHIIKKYFHVQVEVEFWKFDFFFSISPHYYRKTKCNFPLSKLRPKHKISFQKHAWCILIIEEILLDIFNDFLRCLQRQEKSKTYFTWLQKPHVQVEGKGLKCASISSSWAFLAAAAFEAVREDCVSWVFLISPSAIWKSNNEKWVKITDFDRGYPIEIHQFERFLRKILRINVFH